MFEDIVHMGPMLLLAGLVAGWTAEAVSRARGYGFIPDLLLALIGSVVGGVSVWVVISGAAGMAMMFVIGCGGAALMLGAQRCLWRSARLGT